MAVWDDCGRKGTRYKDVPRDQLMMIPPRYSDAHAGRRGLGRDVSSSRDDGTKYIYAAVTRGLNIQPYFLHPFLFSSPKPASLATKVDSFERWKLKASGQAWVWGKWMRNEENETKLCWRRKTS